MTDMTHRNDNTDGPGDADGDDDTASYEPYDYHRAADYTAERESPADGLRYLRDRLASLDDLASPLRLVWLAQREAPDRTVTLSPGGARRLARVLTTIGHLSEHYKHLHEIVDDAPSAAPDWDAVNGTLYDWKRRHALRCWRSGLDLIDAQPEEKRPRYAHAVEVALTYLERFATLEDLHRHYYDERDSCGAELPEHPRTGTVQEWVVAACRAAGFATGLGGHGGGPRVIPAIVEDAAFWRRACEIDSALATRDMWADDDDAA